MARKRKPYVKYEDVRKGLHRPWCGYSYNKPYFGFECDPTVYIQTLKTETGLSYAKIAHDLRADSGCDVSNGAVALWGRKGVVR